MKWRACAKRNKWGNNEKEGKVIIVCCWPGLVVLCWDGIESDIERKRGIYVWPPWNILTWRANHMHSEHKGRRWKSECERLCLLSFRRKRWAQERIHQLTYKNTRIRELREIWGLHHWERTKQNKTKLCAPRNTKDFEQPRSGKPSELDNETQGKDQIKDVPF